MGWQKNLGIFIDIFPISYIPDNIIKAAFQRLLLHISSALFHIHYYNMNGELRTSNSRKMKIRRFIFPILSFFFSYEKTCRFYEWTYNFQKKPSKKVGALSFDYTEPHFVWDAECYKDTIDLPFMGSSIKCPIEYDKWLQRQYGDWHKIVKGCSLHNGMIFDTQIPYYEKISKNSSDVKLQ